MAMSGRYLEPSMAGKSLRNPEETASVCLQQEQRPETPPEVKKWRKSNFHEPGARVVHPGAQDDVKRLEDGRIFGQTGTTLKSDHINDVWTQPGAKSEYAGIKQQMKESIYYSAKREPLGTVYSRGHQLPDHTQRGDHRFGVTTNKTENAKELLYPDEKVAGLNYQGRDQYKRSHHSYDPGEQRKRDYEWGDSKPDERVFGRSGGVLALNGVSENVASVLKCETDEPTKRIASKRVEDYKGLQDTLSRAKNLGHGPRELDPNFRYGMSTLPLGEDAKSCIEGSYSVHEQMPDPDLGKSCTPGFRNVTTEQRAFGVPSVRTDIPMYAKRSVADHQNYGDDVNARFLIQPGEFSNMGIQDEDFFQPRNRQEIEELFQNAGIVDFEGTILDALWKDCCNGDLEGSASIQQYQLVLNDYIEARDHGDLNKWLLDHQLL
mmetsp:Transcript_27690/g.35799  ORF Transcript_27690/g.35799 Transcript_27690/m.35799 type:complete len:434 (+) Transcript_27690:157-1458(+)